MSDTGPAKLPGIPALQSGNPALDRWAQAVAEHLEVRNGARGNPAEKVLTQRDLPQLLAAQPAKVAQPVDVDDLVGKLLENPAFKAALAKRAAYPATESVSAEAAGVSRAELDALSRRVNAVATGGGYGDGFESAGVNLDKWKLKDGVVLGGPPDWFTLHDFLLDLYERLVGGSKPSKLSDDTILFNSQTTRQLMTYIYERLSSQNARMEQIGQQATYYLQSHEARIGALESRPTYTHP